MDTRSAPEVANGCFKFSHRTGLVLLLVGFVWPLLSKLSLGRLPGDIVVERESFTFHFPLVTNIVISILLSLVLWFLNR